MTSTFVPLRRVTVWSVAITLFAAPVASAQTPEAAPPNSVQANTVLLSPAAFARLVQPPPADVASAPVIADSPRPSLLRQGTAAVAREARTAPPAAAQPPRRRSLANWQKQVLFWGAVVGGLVILANLPDD
jgi:hypothetical protein